MQCYSKMWFSWQVLNALKDDVDVHNPKTISDV
jgi:hypothetical protein